MDAKSLYLWITPYVWDAILGGFVLYAVDVLYSQADKTPIQFRTNAANTIPYSHARCTINLSVIHVAEAVKTTDRLPDQLEAVRERLHARRHVVAHPWELEFRHREAQAYKDSGHVWAADLETVGLLYFVHNQAQQVSCDEPFGPPRFDACHDIVDLIVAQASNTPRFPFWYFPDGWAGVESGYWRCIEQSTERWGEKARRQLPA